MSDIDDADAPDLDNPITQHLIFNQLFHDMEACDSTRVSNFMMELMNTVIYIAVLGDDEVGD